MNRDELETLAGNLIDGPAHAAAVGTPRELGDLLLLHALLEHLQHPVVEASKKRVERVLSEIRSRQQPHSRMPSRARYRWTWALTAAASLSLAIGFGTLRWRQDAQAAGEVLERAVVAAQVPAERVYEITFTPGLSPHKSYSATLYLRGERRFVLKHPGPLGEFVAGSNGEEVWLVPAAGPVIVSSDTTLLDRWLGPQNLETGMLQLPALLARSRERYDFTSLPADRLPGQSIACARLAGQRRSGWVGPDTIDLWIDPDSNILQRATLAWKETSLRPWREIVFALQAQTPLADDWYDHRHHHQSDRPVVSALDAELPLLKESP